jgi:very-short-patch-repair endonuclease
MSTVLRSATLAAVEHWTNVTEHRAYRALAQLDVDFIPQYAIDRYRADAFLPKYNVVVEFDDPGHRYEPRLTHDALRDEYLAALGYYTLRIPYSAIQGDTVGGIRAALESIGVPYNFLYGQCTLTIDEIATIEARMHMYLSGYIDAVGMLFPVFRHREF